MKHLKLFEQYNVDIDPYGEEDWFEKESTYRESTPEEREMMKTKLKNYTYNYRDIIDDCVSLVHGDDDGSEIRAWGKIPISVIMNPNVQSGRRIYSNDKLSTFIKIL